MDKICNNCIFWREEESYGICQAGETHRTLGIDSCVAFESVKVKSIMRDSYGYITYDCLKDIQLNLPVLLYLEKGKKKIIYDKEGLEKFLLSPKSGKPIKYEHLDEVKTCRTCENRERWEFGDSIIQYCRAHKSNRTYNGLQKIKVTDPACGLYRREKK